jgi:7,8-dihydropterin-6-yl-methyl-4-(beta-D-ribofuranosyl)aminobenzene 5'-phosphate synthase
MIKHLKITTIADNLVLRAGLWGQWGLSYLLELTDSKGANRKVLFDTANDKEPFLYNIEKLELNLSNLDAIVLSHGHGDHTVATVEAVEMAGGCPVYAHPHCFLPRYYETKEGRRIKGGVPEGQRVLDIEKVGGKVILSEKPVEVVPGLWTTGEVSRVNDFEKVSQPLDGGRRIIMVDGEEKDDLILCDQSLWMEIEDNGCWVITGCAHSGPVNTVEQVCKLGGFKEVSTYIGGTHLVARDKEYIMRTAEELKRFNLKLFSPCHCTGFNAMSLLHKEFGDRFAVNYCGRVFKSWEKPKPMVL